MRKSISATINMPTTEEGMAALREAVADMNGRLIACGLRRVEASAAEKLNYIKSLNGVVPWAGKG